MVGQQIQLAATITGGTGPVTWSSDNAAVATVNSTGLVAALTLGQVTITATSGAGSGTAALTTTTGIVFATVTTGSNHTCGVTPGGVAYCWGDNSSGQLGNGTTTNSATPVPVAGGLSFSTVSAGGDQTCGLTPAGVAYGVAYCWGNNSSGQLGNGTTTNSAAPIPVVGGFIFDIVTVGGMHACGGQDFGAAYCWGDNSSGQLGNGTTTNSSIPVGVLAFNGISTTAIGSAGSNHTCGSSTVDGFPGVRVLVCWGDNSSGQLGNGTTTNSAIPVGVATNGYGVLSAGTLYTCAAEYLNGETFTSCWGNNSVGQLGNGTTMNSATPTAMSGGLNFNAVSAGGQHACGLVNGTAFGAAFSFGHCWGDNSSGQLGNGTMTNSATPIVVEGTLDLAVVSAGGSHTCGVTNYGIHSLTAGGAVYCWGDNTDGQLGNSWTTSSSLPVNVAGAP